MTRNELKSIVKEVIEESKVAPRAPKRKTFEEARDEDNWSIFTDSVLKKLEKLDLADGKDYLTDLVEKSKMKPANVSKVTNLIESSRTQAKLLTGAYNFRLASLGLANI